MTAYGRIDWTKCHDLDPEEPDARVVAEALCTRGPSQENRIVISHDSRPLYLAKRHGFRILHVGDNWLRPKEISDSDKRVALLQREIDAMKNRQPQLKLSFRADKETVSVHRVRKLSDLERREIQDAIIQLHPIPDQEWDSGALHSPFTSNYDHSLTERYRRWEKKIVPKFMREYERKLELNFGQVEIIFRIENNGQVPAESLLIRLSVRGGWLNERFVFAAPTGPGAPKVRRNSHLSLPTFHAPNFQPIEPPGKHEFVVQRKPERSAVIEITCTDFRHGYNHEYRMIGWADPYAEEFRVEAVVTAANLHGEAREVLEIRKTVTESSVHALVDPESLKFRQTLERVELLNAAIKRGDFSAHEFDGAGWDK